MVIQKYKYVEPVYSAFQLYSIEIAKKVEVDEGAELTEEFLYTEIHPVIFFFITIALRS